MPVTQNTNTRMKSPESAISKKATPHWLVVDVTGYYDGAAEDPRVPRGFRYTLYPGGTRPTTYTGGTDLGSVDQQWLNVGVYNYDQTLVTWAQGLKDEMLTKRWCLENVPEFAAAKDYLPLRFKTGRSLFSTTGCSFTRGVISI